MSEGLLICYPNGLGDCILLTPVLRNYFFSTGNKASIAILERFKTAKIFDNNPYVDQLLYTKDAWNDFETSEIGFKIVMESCVQWCQQNEYEYLAYPRHDDWNQSKILLNLRYCNIDDPGVGFY